jgi:hypothetical protein
MNPDGEVELTFQAFDVDGRDEGHRLSLARLPERGVIFEALPDPDGGPSLLVQIEDTPYELQTYSYELDKPPLCPLASLSAFPNTTLNHGPDPSGVDSGHFYACLLLRANNDGAGYPYAEVAFTAVGTQPYCYPTKLFFSPSPPFSSASLDIHRSICCQIDFMLSSSAVGLQ